MRRDSRRWFVPPLAAVALAVLAAALPASAGDGPDEKPAKPDEKPAEPSASGPTVEAEKGPYIAWARTYGEAAQEAAERNVCIYLHSHGST